MIRQTLILIVGLVADGDNAVIICSEAGKSSETSTMLKIAKEKLGTSEGLDRFPNQLQQMEKSHVTAINILKGCDDSRFFGLFVFWNISRVKICT